MDTTTETNTILSRKQAAAFLGICLTSLDHLGIPRTKVGGRVMYRRDVLDRWVVEQTENGKRVKR